MPRIAANGAVISDDSQWYYTGFQWKPLVDDAAGKPGWEETADAGKLAKPDSSSAGKKLAALVSDHGSLQAAERAAGEAEAGGLKQKLVTYKNTEEFQAEAPRMMAAGWRIQGQSAGNDHTTAGRVGAGIVVGGVLTGGVGALVGGALGAASKKKGQVQVTWERD
ncbi:hypothetical protein F4561_006573 [Lipingzhangella halophila]|uniref:Uncharacterized protein n=1 Tax=Lipingzhangella halophila TaxID=1783352 RepID=A0A7W7RP92_9ACTN|nr:hypothetical protein [Lipingzhangella halophila]MBB4935664.1 hypothetical protein [Lipingzhangella halophila]